MTAFFSPQGPVISQALRRLCFGLSLAAGLMAGLILVSTFVGWHPLEGPGLVPMSPLGALLVLLLVAALLSLQAWPDPAGIFLATLLR